MHTKRLTKKEQKTLWCLMNYPTLNDKAVAKKTRLKLSTITAIRRRFREKEYYRRVNIPNFYRLGYELLSVEYGPFNEAVPVENRIKYFKEYLENDPNSIFALMGRSSGIVFSVAKNYAVSNSHYENMEMFFTSHNLTDEAGWKRAIFPFQTSNFWNFFDFSPVIRYSYDIKRKINLKDFASQKDVDVIRLTKKEKRVIYGLVKYPEQSDNRVADRFDVSRQAVSTIKRRFAKEDLITTKRVMNLEFTKCELVIFAYTYFGTRAPMEMRETGLDFTKNNAPTFVGISSNFENILMAAMRNYPEFEKLKEKILSFYKTHLSIAKPPEILLFPIEDILYTKNLTFHGLLGKSLGFPEKKIKAR
jgi:DNA-binding MarR family transcriptional regulator